MSFCPCCLYFNLFVCVSGVIVLSSLGVLTLLGSGHLKEEITKRRKSNGRENLNFALPFFIAAGIHLFALLGICIYLHCRKKKEVSQEKDENQDEEEITTSIFSLNEKDNFKNELNQLEPIIPIEKNDDFKSESLQEEKQRIEMYKKNQ